MSGQGSPAREEPVQVQIRQKWRHTGTGHVIAILSPKLDTTDDWYVMRGDYRFTLTTAQIALEYLAA